MSEKRRFLVVDDHPIFRHGVVALIQSDPRYVVVAEAGSVPEALTALETHHPDMALVDLSLGGQNGLELLRSARDRFPEVKVLVVSIHDETVYADRVLKSGARGYLMKQAAGSDLKDAIRAVLAGKVYLSPAAEDQMLESMYRNQEPHRSLISQLSDRELEVLEQLGRGYGASEIAGRLGLSVKTVGVYQDHIKRKLALETASDLRRYAIHWLKEP